MVYEHLLDEIVGYRTKKSFINNGQLVLEPLSFGEFIEPYAHGLDGDLHLYLRIKDDLEHIRQEKNHLREDASANPEELAGFYLEKMCIQRAMILLRKKSEDPAKEDWDGLSLEDYLKRHNAESIRY